MSEPPPESAHDRLEARRRAIRRRRTGALLVLALLLAGGATGVVMATRHTQHAAPSVPPPTTVAAATAHAAPATTARPAAVHEPAAATGRSARVTIAAVGDIVMGTPTYGLPPDGGRSFFDGVDQDLVHSGVVLGNLEGTLSTGGGSKCGAGSSNCFAFQTPPSYARWLKRAGFTVLNVANNHAYDYGTDGQRQTLAALKRVGLLWTGRPGQITIEQVGRVKVALIGFAPYSWAQSLLDLRAARRIVRKAAAEADVVIVTMHAGAEGSDRTHVTGQEELFLGEDRGNPEAFAHAVVRAGADLVVGSGPHVLRGMEWYHHRLIAYSLGNFGGYRVFSLGGDLSVSGILKVTLRGDGSWAGGRLVATDLAGAGVPALDPAERAHGLVRELSQEDFGPRGIRVSKTGRLEPPGR